MRYLLDTNILSVLIRLPRGTVSERLRRIGGEQVYTSVIVAAVLGSMSVESWQAPYDRVYADLRLALERAGTPIGANDLLIGAQALADGSVLVTDNTREFQRVAGLTIENWLQP